MEGKACCDVLKSEATYDEKNDKCNCLNGKEFQIIGGKGQCVAKNCTYIFDGSVTCNGKIVPVHKEISLTEEQLDGMKCEQFQELYATDEAMLKQLADDVCGDESSTSTTTTTVSETSVVTEPSDYEIRNAQKTLEAFTNSAKDDRSVWRTAEGKFNTTRLASDITAGVVLGTVGGVVTGVVIKKNQVKKGFEALHCTVGGQKVAEWGDEFSVGLKR